MRTLIINHLAKKYIQKHGIIYKIFIAFFLVLPNNNCIFVPMESIHAIEKELTEAEVNKGIRRKWIPAKDIIKKLEHIRNTPELWKTAKISGCDQYQGGPMFLRHIDEIINLLR